MHLSKAKDVERLRRMALASRGLIGSPPFWQGPKRCGQSEYCLEPSQLDRPMPRLNNRLKSLSPFDNAVIQRKRLIDLFGFD